MYQVASSQLRPNLYLQASPTFFSPILFILSICGPFFRPPSLALLAPLAAKGFHPRISDHASASSVSLRRNSSTTSPSASAASAAAMVRTKITNVCPV